MLFRSGRRTFSILVFSALLTRESNSPQSFKVVLSTTSADLWVTGPNCTACSQDAPSFNDDASSTFEIARNSSGLPIRVTLSYGNGTASVAGDLVRDTVAMGGFQVPLQPWLRADQIPSYYVDREYSGIFGLAFEIIASTGAVPFWQTLADSGQLTTPEMSFWFTRFVGDQNAQEEEFGGIFTLGGQNKTLYTGDVEFLPLVTIEGRKAYWILNVSGVYLIRPCLVLGYSSPTRFNLRDQSQWKEHRHSAWWHCCR